MGKRLLDTVMALVGLIVLAPLLVLIATAIVMETPGSALFRQRRVGLGGRDIILWKFRTMTLRQGSESGSFDLGDASRVTKIGCVLRATKLDELPQLWNVIRGDMALVGPRPEVRKWVDCYPQRWALIHTVRPGITDPASIAFRHEEEILQAATDPEIVYREIILPQKLELYELYLQQRGFWEDSKILCRTLLALLTRSHEVPTPASGLEGHDGGGRPRVSP